MIYIVEGFNRVYSKRINKNKKYIKKSAQILVWGADV
jgi:hypothetical protein